MNLERTTSVFRIRNIRLFILFRLFFNSRFYYPVFTILFLDFGLTIEQFAILNVIWAATIVLMEVPSGALADIIGRRNLLVATGYIMVVEIAILCVIPLGNVWIIFIAFAVNRVLSGLAEAAASGADEAIAYDTLKRQGLETEWSRVLDMQMRVQSIGFIIALSVGAAVYDPNLMQTVLSFLGFDMNVTQAQTLRLPLVLTLGMAVMTLVCALAMREVTDDEETCFELDQCGKSISQAFQLTMQAGRWIIHTPLAMVLLSAGLVYDHVIRMTITLNSEYYRLIQLPEATFGLIGSGIALQGLFIPRLASRLVQSRTLAFNIVLLAVVTLTGLAGMALFIPYFGIIPVVILFSGIMMLNFMTSHYLNQITPSHQRATVLSFKGLSQNLAYGIIGILYSLLVYYLRQQSIPGENVDSYVFMESIRWFPWYFLVIGGIFLAYALTTIRKVGGQAGHGPGV